MKAVGNDWVSLSSSFRIWTSTEEVAEVFKILLALLRKFLRVNFLSQYS
jgi:hypothetical protein